MFLLSLLSFRTLVSLGLDGQIPESIGDLDHLTLLDLSSNNFTGEIPQSIEPTSNLKLQPNQEIRVSSSKNPVAKKRFPSKNNIPLKKTSQSTESTLERISMPLSFTSEKIQEQDEENGTLNLKDANKNSKTILIRPCFNIKKPPVAIKALANAMHQRYAAKKTGGTFHLLKLKVLRPVVSLPFSRMARIAATFENTIRLTQSGLSTLLYSLC
jgi:hypothetical protein